MSQGTAFTGGWGRRGSWNWILNCHDRFPFCSRMFLRTFSSMTSRCNGVGGGGGGATWFKWELWLHQSASWKHSVNSVLFILPLNVVGSVQYVTIFWRHHQETVAYVCSFKLTWQQLAFGGLPYVFSFKTRKGLEQQQQKSAARLVFRTSRSAHVAPMLLSLHWLPVEQFIEYRLSLLCFKTISDQATMYISELLHALSRQLRSSADNRVVQNTILAH